MVCIQTCFLDELWLFKFCSKKKSTSVWDFFFKEQGLFRFFYLYNMQKHYFIIIANCFNFIGRLVFESMYVHGLVQFHFHPILY